MAQITRFLRDSDVPDDLSELWARVEDLRSRWESQPGDMRVAGLLGDALRALGELPEAEALLREAVEAGRSSDPALLAPNLIRLATTVQYADRHAEAAELFREAIALTDGPRWSIHHNYALQHYGKCLAEQRQYAKARDCFEAALRLRTLKGDESLVRSTNQAMNALEALIREGGKVGGMTIRQATPADAERLGKVHVGAWQWAYRGLMPDDYLDALNPVARADMWKRIMNDGQSTPPLLALDGEKVVGFCHAGRSRDDHAMEQTGEVTAIYLASEYVGTGTGRKLWDAALDQLHESGHTSVTVWVLDTNTRGRTFYERVGMEPDGAMKSDDLRGFPITEVRYRRELGQP